MAPPTVVDSWLAGRHFGVVIDAGSSGSRLQIYSWKDPRTVHVPSGSPLAYTLPRVEKGTRNDDLWVTKVEPGLSSLENDPQAAGTYLQPLLNHARNHIPPSLHKETPLFLLATAGMRLLSPKKQAEILLETCQFLSLHSEFKIDGPSEAGPCGSSVRIITGEEEGLFGWIAVNYLMDGFVGSSANRTTYGFLDMGGASTQIAFEPKPDRRTPDKDLIDVRLRLLNGEEIHHKVFVTTWLGYGTNQARERYVGKAITNYDSSAVDLNAEDNDTHHFIPDPCLPKNLELFESPIHSTQPTAPHLRKSHRLIGTGSFEQCVKATAPLLNNTAPCPDTPCLMNGVRVPPIDFSVSHFIGVSEYWYSSEHIFGLGGAYDFVQYERAASAFCSQDWQSILKQHEASRVQHHLGGDGELEKDGKVVGAGYWGPEVEIPRLQMQCFKAAWITNVLHEGIKMPRIVDPGGNVTTNSEDVIKQAGEKGLGRPTFQSMDSVGDIAISWTLGKMVLEASKEVPPKARIQKPIVDPIDDIEDLENSPIHPIRPPFWTLDGLEDRLHPHLPSSLTRGSLGFSPVLLLLYAVIILVLLLVIFPNRRKLRGSCLRSMRKHQNAYGDLLEEGRLTSALRPSSPTTPISGWLYPIRKVLSPTRPKKNSISLTIPPHRQFTSNGRSSPQRSFTTPATYPASASSTRYDPSISRSPSPAPGFVEDGALGGQLSARSMTASQVNLAIRPNAISRSNSAYFSGQHAD